jgi:hypothetical protein
VCPWDIGLVQALSRFRRSLYVQQAKAPAWGKLARFSFTVALAQNLVVVRTATGEEMEISTAPGIKLDQDSRDEDSRVHAG